MRIFFLNRCQTREEEYQMTVALILAGGKGTRMMQKIPKQFLTICDKPLIIHTLLKFERCPDVDKIAVICLSEFKPHMQHLLQEYNVSKVKWIIDGGNSRHRSIKAGIDYLFKQSCTNNDIIIIHNANMPMITIENISKCINLCKKGIDIATTAAKCNGYFYELEDDKVQIGPDREKMFGAKTPEALKLGSALEIYGLDEFQKKKYESYTAGMLGIEAGKKVGIVLCDSTNIKVTTEDDYRLVSTYLSNEKENICI